MMTYTQANEVADLFREIGGFSKIEVDHFGFWDCHTAELDADGKWHVQLWSVNARAGNRNLHTVKDLVGAKEAKLIAKQAKGKANDRDKAALARMAAERAVNAE